MTTKQILAGYFVVQALVGVVLWVVLALSPMARSLFDLAPDRPVVVDAFLYPDLGVIVVGSLVTAWAIGSDARWALPVAAFTAGAVLYPTVYLVGWVVMTGGVGAAALAIMVPPSTSTVWITYYLWRTRPRLAPTSRPVR